MEIATIGIDLAKNVFQIHAANQAGKAVLRKQLKRHQLLEFFANLKPCLIGLEACSGAHHWARSLSKLGHTVKMMPPQFVKPYVKTNKNDMADAEAICEAVTRPNMRFVPIKSIDQQAILSLHRVRQSSIQNRTGLVNQIRGLLAEFGHVVPKGLHHVRTGVISALEKVKDQLPSVFLELVTNLLDQLKSLSDFIEQIEKKIQQCCKANEDCMRLTTIPGVGPLTATALVASVADAKAFKNGRQMACWLGLVPRQHSSGGKNTLLGISKRGNTYLRTLMANGGRSVIIANGLKHAPDPWLNKMLARRHYNVTTIAMANRNARIAWALLTKKQTYDSTVRSAWQMQTQ
jgi:transposase